MVDSKRIKALVVDDEPPGRRRIRELLHEEPDVVVIGESTNGVEAIEAIRKHSPDLVFLDIQMPEVDGFGVVEAIGPAIPTVIFTTAYDQYALQAFEVHALDYLLKPFDKERFQTAMERARVAITKRKSEDISEKLLSLLQSFRADRKGPDRLVIKSGGRVFFLKTDEIDWIEAAGNYIRLHVNSESHLLRETMSGIQKRLDVNQFIRIHRSTFVNLERIKELQPWFHGEYVVILQDGTQLTMSRSYRSNLPELLGKSA